MKPSTLVVFALFTLVGCTGPLPETCTVAQQSAGALVSCPDGSSALILNGKDGQSVQATSILPGLICPTGGVVLTIGGTTSYVCNGAAGANGVNGQDGQTPTLATVAPGAECPTGGISLTLFGITSYVCNGATGQNGADGQSVAIASVPAGDPNCPAGGVKLTVGTTDEYVCNGLQGEPGLSPQLTQLPAGSDECPAGGVLISLGNDEAFAVCNGLGGSAGPVGPQGPAGDAGVDGTNGTSVTVTVVPNGDPNCPNGGAMLTDGQGGIAYVCNGAPGTPGTVVCAGDLQWNSLSLSCGKVCHDSPDSLALCPADWISPTNSCSWPQFGTDAVCL